MEYLFQYLLLSLYDMSEFGYKIGAGILRAFQRLPLGFHYGVGKVLAWFLRSVMHYRSDVVMVNLSRSFPEKKYDELSAISKESYARMGEIFAETMWFGGCRHNPERFFRSGVVNMVNIQELRQAYSDSSSVMILNSHFGNWEFTGGCLQYLARLPDPVSQDNVCVVYKRFTSKFWDRFIGENRCAVTPGFKGYIEANSVLRYAVSRRREKVIYLFPTDQYPYGQASHWIPSFMHQPTNTMTGGAALACKLGMSVWHMCVDRISRGRYDVSFRKICDDASTMTPDQIMEDYYAEIEKDVTRKPTNYLWTHKRWK